MSSATGISVHPLTAVVGAEIEGIDLRRPLDDGALAVVRQALRDHLVVFFRDQDITPAQQLRFSEYFGPVMLPLIDTQSTEAAWSHGARPGGAQGAVHRPLAHRSHLCARASDGLDTASGQGPRAWWRYLLRQHVRRL